MSEDVPSQAAGDDQQEGSPRPPAAFVWGSYILAYGGLGLWLNYRWRAFRKAEGSFRARLEILRKQFEAEELAAKSSTVSNQSVNSASSGKKPPPTADKAVK